MTFPLSVDGTNEASLFVDSSVEFVFGGNMGVLHQGPHFELIAHTQSHRSAVKCDDAALSEHPLLISEPSNDEIIEDRLLVPFSGHKMGGRPYFVHGEPLLENEVALLMSRGFRHAIQVDFPGMDGDADVSGDWPFGTGLMHVLCKLGDHGIEWRVFWEG